MSDNSRIAKNTLFLYIRLLITLVVGLYTSRVVLSTLGASDYGLYNVVGGIVVVLASINGTLASGTQRFISFALGEKDENNLNATFSTAQVLHLLFALVFLLVAETIGLWFLNMKMNIPEGRETAAFWVFQFSIISTLISIIQVPFMSAVIAHERMGVYAYLSIYDAVAKLVIVYLIQITSFDKLIFYAVLICLVGLSSAVFYRIYCRVNFEECKSKPALNKPLFSKMAGFMGWNVFGSVSVPLQTQGVNILLNIFFNTVVNAARGLAVTVNNLVMQFVNNFQTAVNPQIVKLYAAGKKDEMIHLVLNNSKFAGFLFLFVAAPLFVEIEFVLDLWLGDYPEYTVPFIRIILIQSLFQTLTRPLVSVVHAVGKMKMPNLTAGLLLLSILPITYFLLKAGANPVTVFAVNVIPWALETLIDLYWEHKYIGFPIFGFYKNVYGLVFPIAIVVVVIPYLLHVYLPYDGWLRFFIVGFSSVIVSSIVILFGGITKQLRQTLFNKALSYLPNRRKK